MGLETWGQGLSAGASQPYYSVSDKPWGDAAVTSHPLGRVSWQQGVGGVTSSQGTSCCGGCPSCGPSLGSSSWWLTDMKNTTWQLHRSELSPYTGAAHDLPWDKEDARAEAAGQGRLSPALVPLCLLLKAQLRGRCRELPCASFLDSALILSLSTRRASLLTQLSPGAPSLLELGNKPQTIPRAREGDGCSRAAVRGSQHHSRSSSGGPQRVTPEAARDSLGPRHPPPVTRPGKLCLAPLLSLPPGGS